MNPNWNEFYNTWDHFYVICEIFEASALKDFTFGKFRKI